MAGETNITVVGNLTATPELRFTTSGAAVANFTIASTPRNYDKQSGGYVDGEPLFMRCSIWREQAENVAESLDKGHRVIATGTLKARSYETREGDKRTAWELDVQEIGPALRFVTASISRSNSGKPKTVNSSTGFSAPTGPANGSWDVTAPPLDEGEPPF